MNKLRSNLFIKRHWGSEITWALTDNYMAKTVEVQPHASSDLLVHTRREKSLIVIKGPLYLVYGRFTGEEISDAHKLPEGWSWTIEPGYVYKYISMKDPVMLIEISTPELDDAQIIVDDEHIDMSEEDFEEPGRN